MKNTSGKIPQKSNFFWNFVLHKLWRVRKKRNYFAQSRFPKYRYFFDVRGQKTAKIRPPPRWVRRHNQNKYPRKRNMSSGESQKKVVFLGFFEMETAQTWISQAIRNLEIIILNDIIRFI